MQQVGFTANELQRIGMIGNSTDSTGIEAFYSRGESAEPYMNGSVPIRYNADGWAIQDLIATGNFGLPITSDFHRVEPSQKCFLILAIFKLKGIFSSRYVANITVIHEYKEYYLGSFAARSLDALIVLAKAAIAGKMKLANSTEEAISRG